MGTFTVLEPKTLDEAMEMLAQNKSGNTFVMAGATDLIPPYRSGAIRIKCLVDISNIGLNTITETEDKIIIGAACTLKQVYTNPIVLQYLPALAAACRSVGAVQTRGLATIGGNSCAAIPSLDTAPPLFVYNADYLIRGADGMRTVNVHGFFLAPGRTVVKKNEDILVAISLTKPVPDFIARFTKFGRRQALSLSIVNCSVGGVLHEDKITNVAVCVGACAATPLSLRDVETYLEGKKYEEIDFAQLQKLVKSDIHPISDIRASAEYRYELAAALVSKHVRSIFGRD